jgi:hypothetical protein
MKATEQKIVGNNNIQVGGDIKITVNQQKKPVKPKYPDGCIGFDTIKANYIGHLIDRYNQYKMQEVGKDNMKWSAFNAYLKRLYKLPPTRTIYNLSIELFDDLVKTIQDRIDKTTLAKKMGKGHKNYSTFEEYKLNQTQERN